MTAPAVAAVGQPPDTTATPGPADTRLWAVTTIIDVLAKKALLYWSAEQAAICAIDRQPVWRAMLEQEGRDAAVKWIRDARLRRPKNVLSATDLGTVVHKLAEEYALTGHRPGRDRAEHLIRGHGSADVNISGEAPVVMAMLGQFDRWAQKFTPAYQAAEMTVYHPRYGYAGTSDGILTVGGFAAIIDYKTSREPLDSQGKPRTPYPEQVALQLAAYRHAPYAALTQFRARCFTEFYRRYYLLSDTERGLAQPVPPVDGGLVIHITPQACDAYPVRCDQPVFDAFLHVLEAARWTEQTSKTVMRPPLEFPGGTR